MAEPFLSEIRIMSFSFAPKGWALCNGQVLSIAQYQALFSLVGTTYGGDGVTTFALPNLQGCAPVHSGNNVVLGERGGEPTHTLINAEMPLHNHGVMGNTNPNGANSGSPANSTWAVQTANPFSATTNTTMNQAALAVTGGSQPHDNMQPYLVINFIIALVGVFPSRN